MFSLKHLHKKDWAILSLVFILILLSSNLFFLIDETPIEPTMPAYLGVFMLIGAILSEAVNLPIIYCIRFLNEQGMNIDYDFYFSYTLPILTASIFTVIVAVLLSYKKKK